MLRSIWILKRASLQHIFDAHHLLNAQIRGFNKYRRPTKHISYFGHSSRLLFSPKKKQNCSFKNVINKKYIINSELKRKFIMMCFQGPLICYALVTPDMLLVTQTLYFSQFFPRFFVGLHRICLCANVLNFDYWHLFIACKKKGTNGPLLKQLVTLFKPAGYYYYYCNPCKVWSFHFKTRGLMILPVLEQMLPLKSSKSDLNLHF